MTTYNIKASKLENIIRRVGGTFAGLSRFMLAAKHTELKWDKYGTNLLFRPTTRIIYLTGSERANILLYITTCQENYKPGRHKKVRMEQNGHTRTTG